MAKREENLKKINAELELMTEEKLDNVAGGTVGETSEDSQYLYDYGLVDDYHDNLHTIFYWHSDSKAVDEGWAKAGITCVTKPCGSNQYFRDGKEITRDEAHDHLKANFKRLHNITGD